MGLLDMHSGQNQAVGGLLDPAAMQPQQGAPMQQGQAGGLPPMPPELLQAIEQMKGAPPAQQQQFMQQLMQKIAAMNHDPQKLQMIQQQLMQALGQPPQQG